MANTENNGVPGQVARVLVVDDHGLSRRYTVAALRQAGLSVKAAATPETALRRALDWLPDAVVVDIQLPGCDGYRWMARLVRAWPSARSRPRLVVLSGATTGPPTQSRPVPDAVLRKPAAPADLYAALQPDRHVVREPPGESAAPPTSRALAPLFRRELERSLAQLDRQLYTADLGRADRVVHRLIASARMCGEWRLEARLRALQAACRGDHGGSRQAAAVAGAYYGVLSDARPILDRTARASG